MGVNVIHDEKTSKGTRTILFSTQSDSEEQTSNIKQQWLNVIKLFVSDIDSGIYAIKNLPSDFVSAVLAKCSRSAKPAKEILYKMLADVIDVNDEENIKAIEKMSELMEQLNTNNGVSVFHNKYTNQGHISISKLSNGINIAIDSCSMLAASYMRNTRAGVQFMERSTRYQKDFFKNAKWIHLDKMFDKDAAQFFDVRFDALMRTAFKVAQEVYEETKHILKTRYPYDPQKMGMAIKSKKEYNRMIHNRALDAARYCLPVATTTGLTMTGNAMGINHLIERLKVTPSLEFATIGNLIRKAAKDVAPNTIRDTDVQVELNRHRYFEDDPDLRAVRKYVLSFMKAEKGLSDEEVYASISAPRNDIDLCKLAVDTPHMSDTSFLAYQASLILSRATLLPFERVYEYITSEHFAKHPPKELVHFRDSIEAPVLSFKDYYARIIAKYQGLYIKPNIEDENEDDPKKDWPPQFVEYRVARFDDYNVTKFKGPDGKDLEYREILYWDKLPRNYEFQNVTFDIVASFGAWRDINTHMWLSQWDWPLAPNLGYATPPEYEFYSDVLKAEYESLFAMSAALWGEIVQRHGSFMAQYAGLMMWHQRRLVRANIREWDYFMQLRSRWPGHPEYRLIARLIAKRLQQLWPLIAGHFLKVFGDDYVLGPLTTEYPAGEPPDMNEWRKEKYGDGGDDTITEVETS